MRYEPHGALAMGMRRRAIATTMSARSLAPVPDIKRRQKRMSVIGTGLKSDHLWKGPRANADGRHWSVGGLWKALRFAALATACCLASVTSASAQEEINVSAKVTGNKVRGPKEIHLTHV